MKKTILALAAVATLGAPLAIEPLAAQPGGYDRDRYDRDRPDRDRYDRDRRDDRGWHGDRRDWNPSDNYRRGNYRERRMGRDDAIYRGRDGRYYCKRNDGTTGLVIGALGGGVAGNLLGGGTLGTLLGAGGGALLGRSVDRGQVRCR